MSNTWIAEEEFRCVPRKGKPFTVTARIGKPKPVPATRKLSAFSRGAVSLEPLVPERGVGAENAFQALCLSIDFIRTTLKVFIAEGGTVYWRQTENPVDLDSPWFCPLPSLKELRRR